MCEGIMDPDDARYGCDCHLRAEYEDLSEKAKWARKAQAEREMGDANEAAALRMFNWIGEPDEARPPLGDPK